MKIIIIFILLTIHLSAVGRDYTQQNLKTEKIIINKNYYIKLTCLTKEKDSCPFKDNKKSLKVEIFSNDPLSKKQLVASSTDQLGEYFNDYEDPYMISGISNKFYKIGKNKFAVGLNVESRSFYSGGGSFTKEVLLLTPKNTELVPIISIPIKSEETVADTWSSDGHRNHDNSISRYSLVIKDTDKSEYYRLIVVNDKTKEQTQYCWSNLKFRYLVCEG